MFILNFLTKGVYQFYIELITVWLLLTVSLIRVWFWPPKILKKLSTLSTTLVKMLLSEDIKTHLSVVTTDTKYTYKSLNSKKVHNSGMFLFLKMGKSKWSTWIGPHQVNLILIQVIAYASSEGSGEPAHLCSLARTCAACSHKQWVKRNLHTESQIPSPSEWLGMRS